MLEELSVMEQRYQAVLAMIRDGVAVVDVARRFETAAAAILVVSQQRVNQIRVEGKLSAVGTIRLGRTQISYRRSDVERLRIERGVGRYGRT